MHSSISVVFFFCLYHACQCQSWDKRLGGRELPTDIFPKNGDFNDWANKHLFGPQRTLPALMKSGFRSHGGNRKEDEELSKTQLSKNVQFKPSKEGYEFRKLKKPPRMMRTKTRAEDLNAEYYDYNKYKDWGFDGIYDYDTSTDTSTDSNV